MRAEVSAREAQRHKLVDGLHRAMAIDLKMADSRVALLEKQLATPGSTPPAAPAPVPADPPTPPAPNSPPPNSSAAPTAVGLPPQEVLIQSIVKDDPALAAKALQDGAKLDLETQYDHKGYIDQNTPLYFAAERGELDLVKLFVERGASVKPGKSTWTNPLDAAIRNGFPDVAAYLHDHGATGDPLVYAAATGDVAPLTELASGKPKNLDEAASAAAGCGQVAALTALLGYGANGTKAFQRAASTGCVDSMRYLLGHGVDAKVAGYEALGHAAYNNRTDTVAFLLKQGVSPNREKQPTDTRFT
jgi:hypothetical protein